jgi:hypothetical protein
MNVFMSSAPQKSLPRSFFLNVDILWQVYKMYVLVITARLVLPSTAVSGINGETWWVESCRKFIQNKVTAIIFLQHIVYEVL